LKLHALVAVYNCQETIYDCLKALSTFCNRIVILEGKWVGYPYEGLHSTDNTRREIERFMFDLPFNTTLDFKYLIADREYHQYEARNILINEVPIGDWFITVDSDEIMVCHPRDTQWLLNSFAKEGVKGLCIYGYDEIDRVQGQGRRLDLPRMHIKTKDMHWSENHRYLDDENGPIVYNRKDYPEAPSFIMLRKGGHKVQRPVSEEYKNWLYQWENRNRDQ
jgi:hypothetical protein